MKLLAIGDPHFKTDNVAETDAMISDIVDIARRVEPDYIVCLGDVLDRFANIHVSPLVRATDFLKQLSLIAPLIVLVGNHDRPNNNIYCGPQHPFNSLKQWANTYVVDERTKIGNILAVPYVPPGRFQEVVGDLEGVKVILAHQEFKGAKMGALSSTIGDEWSLDKPLVISGHIHDYQRPQPNIVYVGTPIQHGYGDKTDKGVSLFDIGEEIHETRYKLPSVPPKLLVRIKPEQVGVYQPPDNALVKVIVTGSKEEIRAVKNNPLTKNKQVRVCYETITDVKPIAVKSRRSYLDNLLTMLDQHQLTWLNEIGV